MIAGDLAPMLDTSTCSRCRVYGRCFVIDAPHGRRRVCVNAYSCERRVVEGVAGAEATAIWTRRAEAVKS